MKKVGIWLDTREAKIHWDGTEELKCVLSEIDEGHVHGGYGSGTKYLPQDAVSDTKQTAYQEEQVRRYFEGLVEKLKSADEIFILGPGEIRKRFGKYLDEVAKIGEKVKANDSSDSVTDNQLRAKFLECFKQ